MDYVLDLASLDVEACAVGTMDDNAMTNVGKARHGRAVRSTSETTLDRLSHRAHGPIPGALGAGAVDGRAA